MIDAKRGYVMKLRTRWAGFTLTELLIAVAILGIISAIAYPSYQNYVRGARRAEARNMLLDASNREERNFADNNTYTDDMTALGFAADPAISETTNYSLDAAVNPAVPNATTYTLTATAQGSQAADDKCDTLTLASTGAKGSSGTGSADECWGD
jgi:type IV pilus assembly protein PilE